MTTDLRAQISGQSGVTRQGILYSEWRPDEVDGQGDGVDGIVDAMSRFGLRSRRRVALAAREATQTVFARKQPAMCIVVFRDIKRPFTLNQDAEHKVALFSFLLRRMKLR